RTTIKNLKTGAVIDRSFREVEQIEEAFIEERRLMYLYHSEDSYHFMDQETYEEAVLTKAILGEAANYMKDNIEVSAYMCDGDIVNINPPIFVELKVAMTEPGIRGNTAKGGSKPAQLETGITVQVPLFIDTDDTIKVDTRTGEYVERVS
ncbi:MAG: elongation factor P, partial [Candidatus Omnitrophota bacterium]